MNLVATTIRAVIGKDGLIVALCDPGSSAAEVVDGSDTDHGGAA